ncbi:MAG: prephenate dehydrogenase/arogenate dehydrogenase family protein [Nitrospinae bacterium]|nr:prephenate dehydrogenase/arogenate dehydrogenase family protein [Nitrospinota bacterium]
MRTRLEKIAIIGVGLIGGSLGLICREKRLAGSVWGHGRSESNLRKAVELGLIDRYSLDLREAVEGADLVVLATPVESIIKTGEKISPFLRENAVVTDVGSAKEKIVRRMEEILPRNIRFVGAHPIAGTEKSGPEAAFAELFQDRYCILTPTEYTDNGALGLVRELWEQTGARVDVMDPEKHDRILALISHLPHMAAYALVDSLSKKEREFPGLFSYVAGGFRDFSRIASSSPVMWKEICLQNGKAIIQGIEVLRGALSEIAEAIENGNGEKLEKIFLNAKVIRDGL